MYTYICSVINISNAFYMMNQFKQFKILIKFNIYIYMFIYIYIYIYID